MSTHSPQPRSVLCPDAFVKKITVGRGADERTLHVECLGGQDPCLVWLGGFRSDITSSKARRLQNEAVSLGQSALLFDYSGHGQSGGAFADGTISRWLEEALAVVHDHGGRSYVLVGSSMGGWIATLLARLLNLGASSAAKVLGLLLIAPAVDMTTELMWNAMSETERTRLLEEGFLHVPSLYSPEPYLITRSLIDDGHQHLLFGQPFQVGCPVHILQGQQDPDVPWPHTLKLVEHLAHDDVRLSLVPDGDHRLSRPQDLDLLARAYREMICELAPR